VIVLLVFGVIVVSMLLWYVVQKRRLRNRPNAVTERWLDSFNYPKGGDTL
jgi:hypothetical protein